MTKKGWHQIRWNAGEGTRVTWGADYPERLAHVTSYTGGEEF